MFLLFSKMGVFFHPLGLLAAVASPRVQRRPTSKSFRYEIQYDQTFEFDYLNILLSR